MANGREDGIPIQCGATACNVPLPYYPTRSGDVPWQRPSRASDRLPSIYEQMGIDPISKLAAAIEKLADSPRGQDPLG